MLTKPHLKWAQTGRHGRITRTLWLEMPLDGVWVAAYRLLVQGRRVVVGELRIFPDGPNRKAGEWQGVSQGILAQVPVGGLLAKMLRRISFRDFVAHSTAIAEHMRSQGVRPAGFEDFHTVVDDARRGAETRRRGRPELDRVFLAEVGYVYTRLLQDAEPAPIRRIAKLLGVPSTRVSKWIQTARDGGLLTPTRKGMKGGELTRTARALLTNRALPPAWAAPRRNRARQEEELR